jgi:hypothetical protein
LGTGSDVEQCCAGSAAAWTKSVILTQSRSIRGEKQGWSAAVETSAWDVSAKHSDTSLAPARQAAVLLRGGVSGVATLQMQFMEEEEEEAAAAAAAVAAAAEPDRLSRAVEWGGA